MRSSASNCTINGLASLSRSIYDFTGYIRSLTSPDNSTERDLWLSFADTGMLDYSQLDGKRTAWFEELRVDRNDLVLAVERYYYASTSRVNQGARLGE